MKKTYTTPLITSSVMAPMSVLMASATDPKSMSIDSNGLLEFNGNKGDFSDAL